MPFHIHHCRQIGVDPEAAVLRKQLSDILDGSINVGIVVRPERKVVCKWSAMIDTVTMDNLKQALIPLYPEYNHDDDLEILFYKTYTSEPEVIRRDEDLRIILRIGKTHSMNKLIISLNTPTKAFSAWTFKDVISAYNLSESTALGLEAIPPFTDIRAAPLDSNLEKKVLAQLNNEIGIRVDVLRLFGANETTKSMVVASFLVAATKLFEKDLFLVSQRNLSGCRGNGPVVFSVHSRSTQNYTLCVTEVKKEDFRQGVAQNIVQLESALTTTKKRKREMHEIDGDEEEPRSYGIVTDSEKWMLIECTLQEDDTVSYRMTELAKTLNYNGKWQDDAKFVFERLVWLWSRMRDEILVREAIPGK